MLFVPVESEPVNPLGVAVTDTMSLLGASVSGPTLFVALLAVVFLVFPCFYLYMALRERGVFRRLRGE